ncbi:MAG TPA: flavoprotein [Candidatus Brocadiia bacterium]|nr:flavoprotein [Candidatus Brocadiia bacterium]
MANIVLGVTGSIAAYKAAQMASTLRGKGHEVQAVITECGLKFITADTFLALTKRRALTDLFDANDEFNPLHVSLSEWADLILIAPATANTIGKIACGLADDVLSCAVMATRCPIIIAPAMNDLMWGNSAVQRNVGTLKEMGIRFIEPESGRLASGKIGTGRLADVAKIIEMVESVLKETKKG